MKRVQVIGDCGTSYYVHPVRSRGKNAAFGAADSQRGNHGGNERSSSWEFGSFDSVDSLMANLKAKDWTDRTVQAGLQAGEERGCHWTTLEAVFVEVLKVLADNQSLAEKHRDHALTGDWKDHRDCHIKPDLILIYRRQDDEALQLVRLGSHSELGLGSSTIYASGRVRIKLAFGPVEYPRIKSSTGVHKYL